jgi:hypothetical protein
MNKNHKCDSCDYETTTLCNYKKHLLTKKHKINQELKKVKDLYNEDQNEDQNENNEDQNEDFEDTNGDNINKRHNIRKSKINCEYCSKLIKYTNMSRHQKTCKINKSTKQHNNLKEDEIIKIKLETENKILKQHYDDLLNHQSSKITYNINYIMNNCKDAYNYDELMNEPLTIEEIQDLNDSSALVGSSNLLSERCIDGIDFHKRP